MSKGKQPQKRVSLPDGWWPQLVGLCNSLWNQPGERLDIYQFTKISKRTFDTAKQTNSMTEAVFIRLMSELGFDRSDELLARLGSTDEDTSVLLQTDDKIHDEVEEKYNSAEEHLSADKYAEAIPLLQDAIGIADRLQHVPSQVKCRTRLAQALYESNENFSASEAKYREALNFLPNQRTRLRGNVLHGLADMLLFSGRINEARATIEAALECFHELEKIQDRAGALISLGLINDEVGFSEKAIQLIDEAIHLLLKERTSASDSKTLKDNAHLLGVAHLNKSLICRSTKGSYAAISLIEEAQTWHAKSGDQLNPVKGLIWKGELHCSNADYEDGFDCFTDALQRANDIGNHLWSARALEKIAKLYANHRKWEVALQAMLAASAGAAEAKNPTAQVQYLCLSAKLLREWLEYNARREFSKNSYEALQQSPVDRRNELAAKINEAFADVSKAIPSMVRNDGKIVDLLSQARDIATENDLYQPLANCLLDEAFNVAEEKDVARRTGLVRDAIGLLEKELSIAESPKRRGHLMGRLSALNRDIGESEAALRWLHSAGGIFEETGDAFGVANYYGSLAEMYRENKNAEKEIESYRNVITVISGRNYPDIAAGTRINLAAALRLRREFEEALALLNEAEQICGKHNIHDFVTAIARNRSAIEDEIEQSQMPTSTMQELLDSLQMLLDYRPELSNSYLAFWYFAFQTEIVRMLRSGPALSLMIVEDDVDSFLELTDRFGSAADHFFMATSTPPAVDVRPEVLPIPPKWRFPPKFPFLGMKRPEAAPDTDYFDQRYEELPDISLKGPARKLPLFMVVDEKTNVEGEGHVMALGPTSLPPETIELMLKHPVDELKAKKAMWLPVERHSSKDKFLTDLRISRERGLIPVYLGRQPSSDRAFFIGAVELCLPLITKTVSDQRRWKNSLMKLCRMERDDAISFLMDIPQMFSDQQDHHLPHDFKICLFEYPYMDKQVTYPVILVTSD